MEEPQVQTLKGSGGGIIPTKLSLLLQTAPLFVQQLLSGFLTALLVVSLSEHT